MKKIFMFLCTCLLLISCGSNNNNTKKKLTKEEVANVYNNIATYMSDLTKNNSPKNIHRKYQESNDYSTLDSTKAMIKWAEYLYKNETFVYSEEFVQFKTTIDNNTLKMLRYQLHLVLELCTLSHQLHSLRMLHKNKQLNNHYLPLLSHIIF